MSVRAAVPVHSFPLGEVPPVASSAVASSPVASSPAEAVLAACALVAVLALVVALARSSTARYEFERNRAPVRSAQAVAVAAVAVGAPSAAATTGPTVADVAGVRAGSVDVAPAEVPAVEVVPANVVSPDVVPAHVAVALDRPPSAGHPAGRALAAPRTAGWWLVDDGLDPAPYVVAGPFEDRIDAEWSALSTGLADSVRAERGALRSDGSLQPETASERAWLVELGLALARLPEGWDAFMSDSDPLGTLVVEVGAALVESGLPLHDCAGLDPEETDPTGGVCLTPDPVSGGILVCWRTHDRMAVQSVRGDDGHAVVQQAMTAAVGDLLDRLGFDVRPLPSGTGHLVIG